MRPLLSLVLLAFPALAQVTYENVRKGPGENWLTYAGD